MHRIRSFIFLYFIFTLSACSYFSLSADYASPKTDQINEPIDNTYALRLPNNISTSEKVIIVDPKTHVFGAYGADGKLIRAGLASAGANWCEDIKRPCRTKEGSYRVYFLGSVDCVSSLYPIPHGGAPMPYCMFFNGYQALHGSPHVTEGNISHGCVRLREEDAEWLRFNFVEVGTKIIIMPY